LLIKRDKDEQPLLLDSLVASFRFVFWEAGIWQTNVCGGTVKRAQKGNLTAAPGIHGVKKKSRLVN
jgi:hypothetical protein